MNTWFSSEIKEDHRRMHLAELEGFRAIKCAFFQDATFISLSTVTKTIILPEDTCRQTVRS